MAQADTANFMFCNATHPGSTNVSGGLRALSPQQGRLQFFLGCTVPYVTRVGGASGSSSIQQRQEGLTLNFVVTFGQPVLIQKDANGEVSILVQRENPWTEPQGQRQCLTSRLNEWLWPTCNLKLPG